MRLVLYLLFPSLLFGCVNVKVPLTPESRKVREHQVGGSGKAKIVVTDISGVLTLEPLTPLRLSKEPAAVPKLREELRTALADPQVVGLVVRIDSPGGSVTASDILYHELKTFGREKGVPVVACIMDKAFSGGYYAALAANEIIAHPTSVAGGVGVISFKFNLSKLLDNWGIDIDTVKSGELKDFWSPLRASRPEEEAIMQGIVDRLHQRFIDLVRENRRLQGDALEQAAMGGIFDAAQAKELGLVDAVGYLDDAVARVRELAGVEQAQVVIYRRPGGFAETIYGLNPLQLRSLLLAEGVLEQGLGPSFHYGLLP